MATVPLLGTYLSSNGNFKIDITSANPSNGEIQGTYAANYSPVGPITENGSIGTYAWVSNSAGQAGGTPFSIRFQVGVRPGGFPYCVMDSWTGAYLTDNTMLLEGARSYVDNKGVVQVGSLGTLLFSL
ncbi:MAG: hypothetical protein JST22_20150 [Bacteroidetes bacterium]|nr:hypothetical protein [Bacteroidota bacterium]